MIVLWAERTVAVALKRGKTAEDCDDLDAGSSQADVGTFLLPSSTKDSSFLSWRKR